MANLGGSWHVWRMGLRGPMTYVRHKPNTSFHLRNWISSPEGALPVERSIFFSTGG